MAHNVDGTCFFGRVSAKTATFCLLWTVTIFYLMVITLTLANPTQTIIPSLDPSSPEYEDDYSIGLNIVFAVIIGTCVLGMYALTKNKPLLLVPFIIYRTIFISYAVLLLAVTIADDSFASELAPDIYPITWGMDKMRNAKADDTTFSILWAIWSITFIAMEIYFQKVTYTCYKKMKAVSTFKISAN